MGPREDPQVDIYNNALYHKENAPLLEVIVLLAKIQQKIIKYLGKHLILSTHDYMA